MTKAEMNTFKQSCKLFYFDKTYNRLKIYFDKYNVNEKTQYINGEQVTSASNLISKIDMDWLCNGIPSQFHGDLQFENILFSKS